MGNVKLFDKELSAQFEIAWWLEKFEEYLCKFCKFSDFFEGAKLEGTAQYGGRADVASLGFFGDLKGH